MCFYFSVDSSQHVTCYSQSRSESIEIFIKRCCLPGGTGCTVPYQQPLCQSIPVFVSTLDRLHLFEVLTTSSKGIPFRLSDLSIAFVNRGCTTFVVLATNVVHNNQRPTAWLYYPSHVLLLF
jgi:hypothetical protein